MSHILILTGSPRKDGNTHALAQAFAQGAGLNNDVEIFSLADIKVNPCCGCNYCFTSANNICCQNDGMTALYDKLMKTDILVVASPIYFFGISSQLKAIIDRLHTPMRCRFGIKKTALLLVAASEQKSVFDAVVTQYKLIKDYFSLTDIGVIAVNGVKDIGDILQKSALNDAFALGASINE